MRSITGGTGVLAVGSGSQVSTVNSSTANLGNGGVFTGTSEDMLGFESVTLYAFSDQSAAANGLQVQWSSDGTNWDRIDSFRVNAGVQGSWHVRRNGRFMRVVMTNGATPQTIFRLQTIKNVGNGYRSAGYLGAALGGTSGDVPASAGYVWNPTTGSYEAARAADADNIAATQIPAVGSYLRSTTNTYMARDLASAIGSGSVTGIPAAHPVIWNGSALQTQRSASGVADAVAGDNSLSVGNYVYNGTGWDRARSAIGAPTGTTATAPLAATAGGATPFKRISTADTNAAVVKVSAGQVYSITASNTNATVRYLKLYDKATAPTVGTDVPVHVIAIPPNASNTVQVSFPTGLVFTAGIAMALTTGATDADNTGVALSEIIVNLAYK